MAIFDQRSGGVTVVTDHFDIATFVANMGTADRLRAILDSIPQMVWSTEPDGQVDFINARWQEFTGIAAGIEDTATRRSLIHPDDAPGVVRNWTTCLVSGEPFQAEFRLRHHSGDYRWALVRGLPLRDADGNIVRWFGTCTDIDDMMQVKEAHQLLVGELSHRIKNIFTVVSSLVSLSARDHPAAGAFAETVTSRISALARANDVVRADGIYAQRGQRHLHALIGALIDPYRDQVRERLIIMGSDAPIGPRAATALALVLHELATNAVKYGALSRSQGTVTIQTHLAADQLVLVWREEGGPKVRGTPKRRGFGTDMAQRAAKAQLGAAIVNEWRPIGLMTTLTVPIEKLEG